MADDIDIEEHDVLDNPRIKDIFPELTKIKTEVLDIDEQEALDFDNCEREIQSPNNEEEAFETRPRGNKIILGSKPSGSSSNHGLDPLCFGYQLNIKQELAYDESDDNLSPLEGNNENISSSLVASESVQNDYHDEVDGLDDNISNTFVYLEDWGPRLDRSHCYCQECMILFPTRNCLDAHNMASHSFLVALQVNKAVKSTSKPPTFNFNKGTARKSTSFNNGFGNSVKSLGSNVQTFGSSVKTTARKSTGVTVNVNSPMSSRYCNHCNKTFVSGTELIKHLYENLTFEKLKCELCDGLFNDAVELQSHMETHTDTDDEFYRCDICNIFNKYKASYENHMTVCHNVKKFKYTKQPYNGQCLLCPQRFEISRYYTRHVKEVHKNVYHKKVTDSVEQSKPAIVDMAVPSTSKADAANNQCPICKLIFNVPASLRTHIQRKHPQLHSQIYGSKMYNNVDDLIPLNVKNLIPKNTLFKCNNCDVHFLLPSLALIHSRTCKKAAGEWTCVKCDINFNLDDEDMHNNQHNFNDTFKVYLIDEIVYEKVLCKCPDCKTYLDDQSFWKHCQNECDSKKTICDICDWPINNNCLEKHKNTHDKYSIVNAFIRIEFVKNDNEVQNNFVFHFCPTCRCCIRGSKYLDHHIRGLCKNSGLIINKKYICKICGLLVRSNRHDDFHISHPQVKLLDMKFVRVTDKKPIAPPIPIYPKCTKCNVCFLSKLALNRHDCKDNYRTCNTCLEKFSNLAYKLHTPFHGKNANMPSNDAVMKKAVMPKLIEKYHMVTKTWNFLFLCKACDIMTDSYDKAVEHCQNHYNNLESYGVTISKCNICDFKFDSSCYEKHREKHTTNKSLNKYSFNVFEYDYNQFFYNECWAELFNNLPEADIQHIISNSIYRFVRTLKMKIISMGAPEFTVYKCNKCKRFVNPPMLVQHYSQCKGLANAIGKRCYQCNGLYSSVAGLEFHKLQHKNYSKMKMRIVAFNDYEDADFNKALNVSAKAPILKINPKFRQRIVYYKCAKCNCCSRAVAAAVHVCKPAKYRRQCPKCKLVFSSNFDKHVRLHQGVASFRYKIVPMKPKGGKTSVIVDELNNEIAEVKKILKCKCDLHFITSKSLEAHLKKCDINNPVPSEKCSKCSLRFPTSVLVNHLLLHHANKKNIEFVVDAMNTGGVLHKCGKCDLHFSSETAVNKHYSSKHVIDFKVSSCTTCGLCFPLADFQNHEANYHDKTGYIKICSYKPNACIFEKTEMVFMGQFRKDLVKLDCYSAELYKCDCETHFLTYSRFYSHLANNLVKFELAPCDICGLIFRKYVMPTHKYVHHEKMGLSREDFEIKDMGGRGSYKGGEKRVCPNKLRRDKEDTKVDSDLEITGKGDVSEDVSDDERVDASTPTVEAYKNYSRYLFKCDICCVHLLTTKSLNKHPQLCGTLRKSVCEKCKLVFHTKSLSKHLKVHHNKMKLRKKDMIVRNIYDLKDITKKVPETDVSKNVAEVNPSKRITTYRIPKHVSELYKKSKKCSIYVFKCNVCSLHFLNEVNVILHVINDNHQEAYVNCKPCNINFNSRAYLRHKVLHHDTLRLTVEDIRVITCHKSNDAMVTDALFRCHKCEVCFMKENSFNKHLNVGCKRDLAKRELCEICNLYFSPRCSANHKSIQHDYLNLEPQDIIVIDYLRDVAKLEGRSKKDSYVGDPDINVTVNKSDSSKSIVSNDLKRYTKSKYKQNGATLYKCKPCDLCFLTLGAINTHFYCNHPRVKVKQCDICQNKFSIQSYPNHKRCHHDVCKLTKNDIHVMAFDKKSYQMYKRALKLKKIDNNPKCRTINDALKSRTINNTFKPRSIVATPTSRRAKRFYRLSDKSKAKLRQSYEKCVYKCKKCSIHYISSRSMEKHQYAMLNCAENRLKSVKCDICDRDFSLVSLNKHKYIHHEFLGLGKDLEVVLVENGAQVKSISNKKQNQSEVESNDVTSQDSVDSIFIDSDEDNENNKSKNNILYRCTDCNLCFLNVNTRLTHIRRGHPMSSKVPCAVCYHNFTYQTLEKHVHIHHNKGKLGRDDLNVIDELNTSVFNESTDYETTVNKDTSIKNKSVSKYVNMDGSSIKNKNKSITNVAMDTSDVNDSSFSNKPFKYNLSEASKEKLMKDAKNCVYVCKYCNFTFITFASVERHQSQSCTGVFQNEIQCDICDLNFPFISYKKHVYVHHEYLKLGKDDLHVVNVDKDKCRKLKKDIADALSETDRESTSTAVSDVETLESRKRRIVEDNDETSIQSDDTDASVEKKRKISTQSDMTTLFKCSICKVYFLSKATCLRHIWKHTKLEDTDHIECKFCSLPFRILSLHKHIQLHHKTEFKLENVLIEEYCPRPDGKQPDPEVYYALDKLQSKLVSTTTERDDNDLDNDDSVSKDKIHSINDGSDVRLSDLISFEDN